MMPLKNFFLILFPLLSETSLRSRDRDSSDEVSEEVSSILGIGSEIVSEITSSCFNYLKKPPIRIGMPDYPTPSSRGYLKNHYPEAPY